MFITDNNAQYTCVKFGEAIYAFIIARANNPFPSKRFSFNNSIITFWMFIMFTLFIIPFIDLRNSSHIIR